MWISLRKDFGEKGPFLFGAFSLADCMFAPTALRLVSYGLDKGLGRVEQDYIKAILSVPQVQEWIDFSSKETEVVNLFEVK